MGTLRVLFRWLENVQSRDVELRDGRVARKTMSSRRTLEKRKTHSWKDQELGAYVYLNDKHQMQQSKELSWVVTKSFSCYNCSLGV